MLAHRFNKRRWRNSRDVRARSWRGAYFMKVFTSRSNDQRDRYGMTSVRNGLCRYPINNARPRSFERYLCRQVNGVVNGSPWHGAKNGRGGECGVASTVFQGSKLLNIFRNYF